MSARVARYESNASGMPWKRSSRSWVFWGGTTMTERRLILPLDGLTMRRENERVAREPREHARKVEGVIELFEETLAARRTVGGRSRRRRRKNAPRKSMRKAAADPRATRESPKRPKVTAYPKRGGLGHADSSIDRRARRVDDAWSYARGARRASRRRTSHRAASREPEVRCRDGPFQLRADLDASRCRGQDERRNPFGGLEGRRIRELHEGRNDARVLHRARAAGLGHGQWAGRPDRESG